MDDRRYDDYNTDDKDSMNQDNTNTENQDFYGNSYSEDVNSGHSRRAEDYRNSYSSGQGRMPEYDGHRDSRTRRRRGGLFILLLILLTLLVLVSGVLIAFSLFKSRTEVRTEEIVVETEPMDIADEQKDEEQDAETMRAMVLDVSGVVQETMPSIVAITNKSVQEVQYFFRGTMEIENESSGSGFIISENEEELLIATNYHVIEGASSLSVCFSVEDVEEELLIVEAVEKGSEPLYDLAVVAVRQEDIPQELQGKIKAAPLGNSEELLVGEPAIAIGNALGYGQSVTLGIISAKNRELSIDGNLNKYLQTDAAINFGNSGGALFNVEGQVVGINSAKATASDAEGMGYAIPIDDARPVLEELMNRKTRQKVEETQRGYLGLYAQDISAEARNLYSIPAGVYIAEVEYGSAAEAAGLKRGHILSKLDGSSVTSTDRLSELLEYFSVGETIEAVILVPDGESYLEKSVEITFGDQPDQSRRNYSQSYGWGWPGYRFGY